MNYFKIHISLFFFLTCTTLFAQHHHFSNGYFYSLYLCNNNSLYTWGDNSGDQLARNESSCNYKTPCNSPYTNNIISVDAGFGAHSLALTKNAKVIAWGHNYSGELGNGKICSELETNNCSSNIPDTVLGGETGTLYLENVQAIAVGQSQSYALLKTGEVVAWGDNSFGQLGNGSNINSTVPLYVRMQNGERLKNIIMISAGGNHVYALTETGQLYSWGANYKKQLACGNESIQYTPQKVIDADNNWIDNIKMVDAGFEFGLFLKNDGTVYGMGAFKGSDFQPNGTRTYFTNNKPVQVPGGETNKTFLENATSISAGYSHAMVIINENNISYVVSWGNNKFPNLSSENGGVISTGNNIILQYLSPMYMKTSSENKIKNIDYIYAGCGSSFIEDIDDTSLKNYFYVVGANQLGQLGTGNTTDKAFLTKIETNLCSPICAPITLGDNLELCNPFSEKITINNVKDNYLFAWNYNNSLILDSISSHLYINTTGTYSITVSDIFKTCNPRTNSIKVTEKEILDEYFILNNSFCSDSLEFKIVTNSDITWYSNRNGTVLGNGNYIKAHKNQLETKIPNSSYNIWIKHPECQMQPINSTKNCFCNTPKPAGIDTTICIERNYFVRAIGSNIIWYTDSLLKYPAHYGNTYVPEDLPTEVTFYVTQFKNNCESMADTINITALNCLKDVIISGNIFDNSNSDYLHKVFLINSKNQKIDSCFSNNTGFFQLFSGIDSVTVFVESSSPYNKNTWLGNKESIENCHFLYSDAFISDLEITLIPIINNIKTLDSSKDINTIEVFSIQGILLNKFSNYSYFELYYKNLNSGMYILRILYKNFDVKSFKIYKSD